MTAIEEEKHKNWNSAKVGIGAGLVAGFALFSSFLSIDQQLNLPHGTFYKTIGIPLGVDGTSAIAIGFIAHMATAMLIGIAYNIAASKWRTFWVVTAPKGMLTGAITGAIVFAIFFLPIHTFVMVPIVSEEFIIMNEEQLLESQLNIKEIEALNSLLWNSDFVLWYSAFLHVLFGVVMGLISGFILHDKYIKVKRIKNFW